MKRGKIKVGDVVDYHSVIGREITSRGHVVEALYPKPNNYGCDCAMITGKSGVVAVAALTLAEGEKDTQFRCTICGQIGTVGRCCGFATREPLNDLARAEVEAQRKAATTEGGQGNG